MCDAEVEQCRQDGTLLRSIDRTELSRFVRALFEGLDPYGYVSLRAFRQFPPDGVIDRPRCTSRRSG